MPKNNDKQKKTYQSINRLQMTFFVFCSSLIRETLILFFIFLGMVHI